MHNLLDAHIHKQSPDLSFYQLIKALELEALHGYLGDLGIRNVSVAFDEICLKREYICGELKGESFDHTLAGF